MNIEILDDAIIPPKTVTPIVFLEAAPAPVANASGNTPNINANEVIMIGRNLNLTASNVDFINSSPRSTLSFANSTINIAFFADNPINVINPICAYTLFVSAGTHVSATMAPNALIGTANITDNGTDQLSYNAARKRKTKTMQKRKI